MIPIHSFLSFVIKAIGMLVIRGPPDCLQAVHILVDEGRGGKRRGEEENRVNESLIKFSNTPISNPHPRL